MLTDVGLKLTRCSQRFGEAAGHALRNGQKMKIVTVVHRRIESGPAPRLYVSFIGARRIFVTQSGGFVVPRSLVNMCGHMNEMTGGGDERRQFGRVGQCAFRMRRGFDGMNVVMNSADMIWISP